MSEVLKVCNLTKSYGKGDLKITALSGLNFAVKRGEFVSVIGKSGSGKSTLLKCISGLEKADSGEIWVGDKNICRCDDEELSKLRRRRIATVFQDFQLINELTVLENIRLPFYLDGKHPNEAFIQRCIERLGLTDKKDRYPFELSGGQQQRAALARALAVKPEILLADEPTGNLDSQTGFEIVRLIRECSKLYEQTVLLVTHDLELVHQAQQVIHIRDGKIDSILNKGKTDVSV